MKSNQLLLSTALILSLTVSTLAGTTETVVFTATVPSILELTTTTNAAAITMVSADYSAADAITKEAAAAHNLSVRSNRDWMIDVKTSTASFAFTPTVAGDTRTKASTDLEVRKASGTYQGLSTTSVTLATGTKGGVSAAGNTFAVDYKVATDIALDPPGAYVLSVIYTLTAP